MCSTVFNLYCCVKRLVNSLIFPIVCTCKNLQARHQIEREAKYNALAHRPFTPPRVRRHSCCRPCWMWPSSSPSDASSCAGAGSRGAQTPCPSPSRRTGSARVGRNSWHATTARWSAGCRLPLAAAALPECPCPSPPAPGYASPPQRASRGSGRSETRSSCRSSVRRAACPCVGRQRRWKASTAAHWGCRTCHAVRSGCDEWTFPLGSTAFWSATESPRSLPLLFKYGIKRKKKREKRKQKENNNVRTSRLSGTKFCCCWEAHKNTTTTHASYLIGTRPPPPWECCTPREASAPPRAPFAKLRPPGGTAATCPSPRRRRSCTAASAFALGAAGRERGARSQSRWGRRPARWTHRRPAAPAMGESRRHVPPLAAPHQRDPPPSNRSSFLMKFAANCCLAGSTWPCSGLLSSFEEGLCLRSFLVCAEGVQ